MYELEIDMINDAIDMIGNTDTMRIKFMLNLLET